MEADLSDEQMEADLSDEQSKNRSTAKNASCDNFESEEMAKKVLTALVD